MKRILFPALILLFNVAHSQNVGIGTGSPAAKLDISSTNSGVLIPRVALTATNSASPLTSPTTSTLVYNTATAGSGATAVVPGFYYWNAGAGIWVLLIDNSSLTGSTTVSNTSIANNLSTTVNGVTGATVPIVNSISDASSGNTLSITVNGQTSTGAPIINTNTLIQNGSNQLTSTINGIAAGPTTLNVAGDVTGNLGASTVVNIQGTPVTLSSLADGNILQYSGSGSDWVNVTPASILDAATTNTLALSTNTLTSTVNGVAATSNAVSGVGNTSSANTLSTTVNGVTGATVPIVNSISDASSGNTLSTTVNGQVSTGAPIINTNTSTWTQSGGLSDAVNGISSNITPASGTVANVLGYNSSGAPVYQAMTATTHGVSNTSSGNTITTTVDGTTGAAANIINSNLLTLSTNTLTSTVNGQAAATSAVSGVGNTWTQSGGLTTTVNGVTGNINPASGTIANILGYNAAGAPVYQAMTSATHAVSNTISGNTISTTVDGTTGTAVTVPNIYTANGTLTGARTVTMSGNTLNFTGGNVGIGNASPASLLYVGSGTVAAGPLAGVNVATGGNSYVTVSDNTRTAFLGADVTGYGMVGTLSNHDFVLRSNNNEHVRLTTAGYVGMGTSSPLGNLDVEATTVNTYGHLVVNRSNASATGGELSINNFGGGTGASAVLAFGTDNSTTFDGSGNNQSNAEIRAVNNNGTTNATDLHFSNWSGSAENVNMDIISSGNVGIGTVSPGSLLQVGSGSIAWTTLPGINVAIAGGAYVAASNGSITTFIGADGSGTGMAGTGSSTDFVLRSNNTEGLRVQVGGNIGIGQASPTQKLDVAGNVTIEGNYITGTNYNQDMILMASDGNWTFGGYHSGSSYFMQATYYDQGGNPSGFRVLDRSNGNTVFSTNETTTSVLGVLKLSSTVSSPKFRVTQVWNQNSGLPGLNSSAFVSGGGTIVISASGSGYNGSSGLIGMNIYVDGVLKGQCKSYTNETSSHKCFNSNFIVVTGLAAGTHSMQLTLNAGTCDANDFFSVTVMELPF